MLTCTTTSLRTTSLASGCPWDAPTTNLSKMSSAVPPREDIRVIDLSLRYLTFGDH